MKSKIPKSFHQQSTRVGDYRLLGLSWGESDIVKIRNSVTASARGSRQRTVRKKAKQNSLHSPLNTEVAPESVARRTRAALAGYRLLDPRFRRQFFDRVQLSYLVYRELDELPRDTQSQFRLPLISEHPAVLSTLDENATSEPSTKAEDFSDWPFDSRDGDSRKGSIRGLAGKSHLIEGEGSQLDDAREIVRLLITSEFVPRRSLFKGSIWMRAIRKVGYFCRKVGCALV